MSTSGYTAEQTVTRIKSATHNAIKYARINPIVVIIQRVRYFSKLEDGLTKYEILFSLLFMGDAKVVAKNTPQARNIIDMLDNKPLL
jgi:hypothetical protein